jgi:iron complex transport system ATP-binding protein
VGGERARVLLARVLAGEPEWLLADEPLANLDPAHQLDGLDSLRAVAAAGAGVVVVLHDLNQAARVADDVLLMRDGRVIAQGAPDAVLTPALIEATYGVAAHIGETPGGQRFIIATHRT